VICSKSTLRLLQIIQTLVMVETVSQSTFNFSSDYTPSYSSFASTMRTCYANNKTPSVASRSSRSSESSNSSYSSSVTTNASNSPDLKTSNLESRRNSCGEMFNLEHSCNNKQCGKRCSNTITTTCLNSSAQTNKPKLQLTTTTFEDSENNLLSSCTTKLSTPQSNGMISQKHQFSLDGNLINQQHLGQQHSGRTSTSGVRQKRSESLGLYRQCSETMSDHNNNDLMTASFVDSNENSNSSEEDLVFSAELSSSPCQHNLKSPRQFNDNHNNGANLCKRCGSNSSLTSFSSVSSSVSSNNLNQYTLTNSNCSHNPAFNPQDYLINNLSHSLNQTFNFGNNSLSPQYGRSRHNSINSLTLVNNVQQPDHNLHALHKALHNIFSN